MKISFRPWYVMARNCDARCDNGEHHTWSNLPESIWTKITYRRTQGRLPVADCRPPDIPRSRSRMSRRATRENYFRAVETVPQTCAYARQGHRRTIGAKSPAHASATPQPGKMWSSEPAERARCAYAAPMGAPIAAPMKSPFAPNAPMGSE